MGNVKHAGQPPQVESYDRLIDGHEAGRITGTSRSRRYVLVKEGLFPQPVKVGKLSKYSLHEIQEYVRTLLASRGGV
jgi:predicted DNA-binding transcriptional regulator AlpA